ncbi:hypothetical protein D3C79_944290 [compost metagenome]
MSQASASVALFSPISLFRLENINYQAVNKTIELILFMSVEQGVNTLQTLHGINLFFVDRTML